MQIRVALADDNKVNRNSFLQKITMYPELQMSFVAEDGAECLEHLKKLPHSLLPQVIFMDLEMPELNGVQAIAIGKALNPEIHFIVLTVFDDDDRIFEAIQSGASGYLMKHEPASVLMDAITNVLIFGGAPMSPGIARKALKLLSNVPSKTAEVDNKLPEQLTEKECVILQHVVKGWDAKRTATALHLSVLTVRKHIANIYQKLHVNSKAQVIHLAHTQKWFGS
jgi:DNA-binding NarL/FixJ family response regulator